MALAVECNVKQQINKLIKSKQITKCNNPSTFATNVMNNSGNVSVDTPHPSSTSTECKKAEKGDKNLFDALKNRNSLLNEVSSKTVPYKFKNRNFLSFT